MKPPLGPLHLRDRRDSDFQDEIYPHFWGSGGIRNCYYFLELILLHVHHQLELPPPGYSSTVYYTYLFSTGMPLTLTVHDRLLVPKSDSIPGPPAIVSTTHSNYDDNDDIEHNGNFKGLSVPVLYCIKLLQGPYVGRNSVIW